jgi:hypothetical protein
MITQRSTNRLNISAEDFALHCTAGAEFLDIARDFSASDEECCAIVTVLHQLKVDMIRDRWAAGTTAPVLLTEEVFAVVEAMCYTTPDDDIWKLLLLGWITYGGDDLLPDIVD